MQQLTILQLHNILITAPHKQFDDDLQKLLLEKIDKNHGVILMNDFNVSVTDKSDFIAMLHNLGMKEVSTSKYSLANYPPPPTY